MKNKYRVPDPSKADCCDPKTELFETDGKW